MASPWSDDNINLLKELVAAGYSASQIAVKMAEVTGLYFSRNAVIGKIHRLKLEPIHVREKYIRPPRRRNRAVINLKPKKASLAHIINQDVEIPEPDLEPIYFEELERHHCRWPKAGSGMDTVYCGAWRLDPLPYCAHHCRRAYQPLKRHDGA